MATYQYNSKIEINVAELNLSEGEAKELAERYIDATVDAAEVCEMFGNNDALLEHLLTETDTEDVLDSINDNAAIREYALRNMDAEDVLDALDDDEAVATELISRIGVDGYLEYVNNSHSEELLEAVLGKATNYDIVKWREDDHGLFNVLLERMSWTEIMDGIDDKVSMVETCYGELGAEGVLDAINDDESMLKAILQRSEKNQSALEDASQWMLERALARTFDAMTLQREEREAALGISAAMLQGSLSFVAVTALKMVRRGQALAQAVTTVNRFDDHAARMAQEEKEILDEALAAVDRLNEEQTKTPKNIATASMLTTLTLDDAVQEVADADIALHESQTS